VYLGPDAPGGVAHQRDPYYPDFVRFIFLLTIFLTLQSVQSGHAAVNSDGPVLIFSLIPDLTVYHHVWVRY